MRWLATAALAFSAAVFAACYALPVAWLPICAGAGMLLALLTAVLPKRGRFLRALPLALLAIAAGFGCFYVHDLRTRTPARLLDGQSLSISGVVLDYPQLYDGYCRAQIRLNTRGLPKLEALVYDKGMWLSEAVPGQRVDFRGVCSAADTRYGQHDDFYNARNVYLRIRAESAVKVSGRSSARYLPARAAHFLIRQIQDLFPKDTAPFMRSLLLGDKSELYENRELYLAMSRAGLMHVVAVSGMHVAFLVSLIQLLLGKTRRSSVLCLVLVWFFVLTTGAGPAAVRAGFMQSLLLLAPLVRRENDPVTSLSAALGLILLVNPFAAASVSLQLSFAAMAGILLLAEPMTNLVQESLPEALRGPLKSAADITATSLSVMLLTAPLLVVHFGYLPLLSPLSNVLALWAVSACFCGGFLCCGLGAIWPLLGRIAAWLVSWLSRYLFAVAGLVSSLPLAVVYMEGVLPLLWVLLCYGLFTLSFVSSLRARWKLLLPSALSALSLCLMLLSVRSAYEGGRGVVTIHDVGQGQCVSVFSGDKTLLVDCGSTGSLENAGEKAAAYLRACGRKQVDVLLLSHLHADHANGVCTLMEMIPVKQILLPEEEEEENGLLAEIRKSAARKGTEIFCLSADMDLSLGGIRATVFVPLAGKSADESCLMTRVSLGDFDVLIPGDAGKSQERALLERQDLSGTEVLIVGHHGSRSASSGEWLAALGGETAVISVGYNTYGHPSNEVLERIDAYGYNVFRTDRNGTVEIRVK